MSLNDLKTRHREILRLDLLGHTPTEISERLEITTQTVRNVQGDALYQQKKRYLEDQADEEIVTARKILADSAVEAATKIRDLVQSASSDVVKLNAARDILDRTGHKPNDPSQVNNFFISAETLADIKSRAHQLKDITPPGDS
jgi:hypothetical protein